MVFFFYDFRESLLSYFLKKIPSQFEKDNFFLFDLTKYSFFSFEKIYNPNFFTKISNSKSFFFLNSQFSEDNLLRMNSQMIYLDCKKIPKVFFKNIIKDIYLPIKNVINSNWKCIQVRAWITKKNSQDFLGPLKFHTDGMPHSIYKIMIYPEPLSEENGSIQFENHKILNTKYPTVLIFKNSTIKHRGVPGVNYDRPVIELTIVRSVFINTTPLIGDVNSSMPIMII
jgi:hypothetical protein